MAANPYNWGLYLAYMAANPNWRLYMAYMAANPHKWGLYLAYMPANLITGGFLPGLFGN